MKFDYFSRFGTQDYTEKPTIPGVRIISPPIHSGDDGEMVELYRGFIENQSGPGCLVSDQMSIDEWDKNGEFQVNYSLLHPGAVKAYHLHSSQRDLTYALGKVVVNLVDIRECPEENPELWIMNHAVRMRFILDRQGVLIPPGVLHSYSNPYKEDRVLIYFTDQFFNKEDEFRLNWNFFGGHEFEIEKG